MTTRLHALAAMAMLLGAAVSTPAWSASAIYQNTGDSGSIELSNLDGDGATKSPLVSEEEVKAGERAVLTAGGASATELQPRSNRTEPSVGAAPATAADKDLAVISKQQKYQDLLMQQVTANGGPGANPYSTRKYLKVDRVTYVNGLNN